MSSYAQSIFVYDFTRKMNNFTAVGNMLEMLLNTHCGFYAQTKD